MTTPVLLHVAAVTNDGHLWHALRQPNSWVPFADVEDLAGHSRDGAGQEEGFKDSSFAFMSGDSSPAGQQLHLCAVTGNGGLLHTMRDPSGVTWTPFGDVAHETGASNNFDRVAIAAIGRELHVCALTGDGHLQHTIRRADSTWLPFNDVEGQAGRRGPFRAAACCGSITNGSPLVVFALGTDGRLHQTNRSSFDGSWTPWLDLFEGSGPFRDVGCAVTWDLTGSNQLQLCLIGENGRPLHAAHVLGDPPGIWTSLGDVAGQAGDHGSGERVGVAAVGPSTSGMTELHVCMTTADGHLWHTIRHPTSWEPFRDVEQPAGDRGPVKAVAVTPADPLTMSA